MKEAHVQELKYKLDDIVVAKGASPLVAGLLKTLLNGIAKKLSEQGKTATFETQKNGVSGFCRPKKAFGWFDPRWSLRFSRPLPRRVKTADSTT